MNNNVNHNIRNLSEICFWLLKIFVTIIICLVIGTKYDIDKLTFTFVTLLCLAPTTLDGIRLGIEQFIIAFFGALLTMFFINFHIDLYITIPLSTIIISYFLIKKNLTELLPIAFFSVLYIGILGKNQPNKVFIERITHLLIGIPIATLLNYFFGIYNYKNKTINNIINLRETLILKSYYLIQALKSNDKTKIENELADLDNYYEKARILINYLKSLEKEYNSWLSVFFRKIDNIETYKYYVWNLHDLLQNIHNCLTMYFKIDITENTSEHLNSVNDIFKNIINNDFKIKPEFYKLNSDIKTENIINTIFIGNLYSTQIHLENIFKFEKSLNPIYKKIYI